MSRVVFWSLIFMAATCRSVSANDNVADLLTSLIKIDSDTANCYRLPGLVLEMGSDKPLDNFPVCFTSDDTIDPVVVTTVLPRAHHYLNVTHSLVRAPLVCEQQGNGQVKKWLRGPLMISNETDWFVGIEHDCGREGCAYQLNFMTSEPLHWCDH